MTRLNTKKPGKSLVPGFFIFFLAICVQAQSLEKPSHPKLKKFPRPVHSNQISFTMSKLLKNQLIFLVSKMSDIHISIKENNQEKFKNHIAQMLKRLKYIQPFKEDLLPYHRKAHLSRQLQLIEDNLRFMLQENPDEGKKINRLKHLYRELTQMHQLYISKDYDKKYVVYYCSKNKSAWIQKHNVKIFNPFSPHYRKCGVKIY